MPQCNNPVMMKYFNACVEVCWLAVVQDPPLVLDNSPDVVFNTAVYREYTIRGPYVDYVVSFNAIDSKLVSSSPIIIKLKIRMTTFG